MEPAGGGGSVIRASTPPRNGDEAVAREVLWLLSKPGVPNVRADLIGLVDAVELELLVDYKTRRRLRFLRDATARRYADRVRARLSSRNYTDRRGTGRPSVWPEF